MADTASTIPATLRATAARYPDHDAVVDGAVRLSYSELDRAVVDTARGLLAMGVNPGDRVAVWAQNCWQWCVSCLGIAAAGAVLVPINTRFRGKEAAYLVDNSEAVALFTTTGFLGADYPEMLRAAAPHHTGLPVVVMDGEAGDGDLTWDGFVAAGSSIPEADAVARLEAVRPDDVSDVMYTSGTTGFPKGVVQTHGKNIVAMRALAAAVGLVPTDRNLVLAPLFAQFGLRCGLFIDIIEGATSVIDSVFDGQRIIDLVERERITFLPGPPTILAAMLSPLAQGRDISSLRLTLTGSTVIPEELVVSLQENKVFDHVLTAYGLTEACGPVSVSSLEDTPAQVCTYAGRALEHVRIKVVDPDSGATLGPDERGEFLVHSSTVMDGYLNDPDGTAEAVTPDGWLHTGDIGLLTEDGYVQVTGRLKDMVIVGGLNVYPAEVENTIREHDAVRDVALIGVVDDRLGEVGAAFIVPEPGAALDVDALHSWCREVLANYKVPRFFLELDRLPLNSSLKVDKLALRERARELGHRVQAG
ncbi:MAG TPA: AMP-binding protein [Pseudonocardia sp.]|jgi:acyl-CoA synthetase (AMP-forming)/AMP-acid ligase II|nr:AMP-binding protein [Pseudonocardia sp.]